MKTPNLLLVTALSALFTLSACDRAKDPAKVAADAASAEQSAQKKDNEVALNASDKLVKAGDEVKSEQRDAAHVGAVEDEKISDTRAEGVHKVALVKCEALAGDAQAACKKKADADLDAAKAAAKQLRTQQDPKP